MDIPVWVKLDDVGISAWEEALASLPNESEALLKSAASKLANAEPLIITASEKNLDRLGKIIEPFKNAHIQKIENDFDFLKSLFTKHKTNTIIFLPGVFPLFDLGARKAMLAVQEKYRPDYSFSEVYPSGLAPRLFGRDILRQWEINEYGEFPPTESLHQFIEKNINKFHVEVRYEEIDLRLLRLDFSCNSKRSILETYSVFNKIGGEEKILESLHKLIPESPSLLREHIGYIELELISDCDFACTFCFRQFSKQENISLSDATFNKIIKEISAYPVPLSLVLTGMGEPLLHKDVSRYIDTLLKLKNIETLIVETNGLHIESLLKLSSSESLHKLKVIVNFNSLAQYSQIHATKQENKDIVLKNLERLALFFKQKKIESGVYLQILKIEENENEIDAVYELCEKLGVEFLFQKYNSYANQMPEKRVSDMTPLERFFCWHLRRDLVIRASGGIPFCKQDMNNTNLLGNINDLSLQQLWEKNDHAWIRHYQNDYSAFSLCNSCDEYYTFNL